MTRNLRLFATATVLSGAASLVHETLWTRFLATALGSTVQAAAAVFAAFLVGLALGARFFGPVVDRTSRVVRTYVFIETGICLLAVTTGFLLHALREHLPLVLGQSLGLVGMVRAFSITLLFVLAPTLLMGATFPAAMAVCRRLGGGSKEMLHFYAMNTMGAVVGTLLCGFFAIPTLGIPGTLLFAGVFNLAAAGLCIPLLGTKARPTSDSQPAPASPPTEQHAFRGHQAWLYAVAILSGAAILALEVVWSRIASFTLGNRIYAFSTLLAWVLTLLAVGSWLSGRLIERFPTRIANLLVVLLLSAAIGTVLSLVLVNAWILSPIDGPTVFPHSPAFVIVLRVLGMGMVMSLFLIPLGCLFPIGLVCLRHLESRPGALSGRYYMWNTVGSVTGSLTAGFLAIPVIGSFGCAAFVAVACAAFGLLGCLVYLRRAVAKRLGIVGAALAGVIIVLIPTLTPDQLHVDPRGERPVVHVEDEWGVFQLSALADGRLRVTNNRTNLVFLLGDFSTSYVQEMQAHIGSFMRPSAHNALVLGSGYGITAGAFTENPTIDRIDAVEILPAIVAAADRFEPYNRSYHRNPRVHVTIDDGRHFLARSAASYDIISVNVTDAHLPGASAMFNADFYAVIKRHLNPDGIAIQHAFGSDANIVLSTLKQSFRYLRAFPSSGNGYNVAVSDSPLRPVREQVDRLAMLPSIHRALAAIGIAPPLDAWRIFSRGLPPSQLVGMLDSNWVSTDDRPLLEFSRRGGALAWFFSND